MRHALLPLLLAVPLTAQITTTVNGTLVFDENQTQSTEGFLRSLLGTGSVGALGNAVLTLNLNQTRLSDDYATGVGAMNVSLTMFFNSLDRLSVNFQAIQDPNFSTASVPGAINTNNSTGAYAGATSPAGAMSLTLTRISTSPPRYNVSMTGSATVGGQSVSLTIVNVPVTLTIAQVNLFDTVPGTCAFPPFGSGSLTLRSHPDSNTWNDNIKFIEIGFTCTLSSNDSIRGFLILDPRAEIFGPGRSPGVREHLQAPPVRSW